MTPDEYYFEIWGPQVREVCIRPSRRDASSWEVLLDGRLVDDGFGSAAAAAFHANRRDFSSENAIRSFNGISVPADLHQWRTARPEKPFVFPNHNN